MRLGRQHKCICTVGASRQAKAVVAKVYRTTQRISTRFRYMNYRASALPPELQEAYDDLVENWRKILLIVVCVKFSKKDFRYAGPSEAAGAERSPWRELSGVPAAR